MKGKIVFLFVLLTLIPSVFAARGCTDEIPDAVVDQDTFLCADNYYPYDYPEGLRIIADNIVLDCRTAVIHGKFKFPGILVEGRENVTIKNCQIANYETGIIIKRSKGITILDTKLIRNYVGIKLIDSTSVVVEDSYDISVRDTLKLINSKGNAFHYKNRNLEGETCRLNQCNIPTGVAEREYLLIKSAKPKQFLKRILNDAIRVWVGAGSIYPRL